MKRLTRPLARSLTLGALALLPAFLSGGLAGCMTNDDEGSFTDTTRRIDPFPRPQGPILIPLARDFNANFAYAEFDSASGSVRRSVLTLFVRLRSADRFGYSFGDPTRGYLIRYVTSADRDSTGVWIVGSFDGNGDYIDSIPTRWLPQHPDTSMSWGVGRGRAMRFEDSASAFLTDVLFRSDTAGAPIVDGFQRHSAFRFRETAGDTVTVYHFRNGVGCLGFERSARGRLLSAGVLSGIYYPSR